MISLPTFQVRCTKTKAGERQGRHVMCSFKHMGAARNYSINYCLRRVIKHCNATKREPRECTELKEMEYFR